MTWATPKTDWDSNYGISMADFNRIEENTQELRTPTEGTNERMGVASFSGTDEISIVVSNTSITANTRIFLTINSITSATPPYIGPFVASRSVGTSFTIKVIGTFSEGGSPTVSGTIAWKLYEPHS